MEFQAKMNKKGISDIFIMIAGIFALILMCFMVTKFMILFQDSVQDTAIGNNTLANESINTFVNITQNFDYTIFAVFIMLFIVVIVLATWIPANPIILGIFILLGVIGTIFSVAISNAYQELAASTQFNPLITYYPITDAMMNNLPLIFAVLTGILIIVTYIKVRQEPAI